MDKPMKMYILVKNDVDLGHAMLAVAHGVAACMRQYKDDEDLNEWLLDSFRKVVCKVNQKEFDAAKTLLEKRVIMTECALDNQETAIVFCPRKEWPKPFSWYKLYRTQKD